MKHNRILAVIVCASFVSLAWGQQSTCTAYYTPWTEFHSINMERWNPCEHALNANNVGGLRMKWSYTTGSGVFSSPAVVNGVVYVGSYENNV